MWKKKILFIVRNPQRFITSAAPAVAGSYYDCKTFKKQLWTACPSPNSHKTRNTVKQLQLQRQIFWVGAAGEQKQNESRVNSSSLMCIFITLQYKTRHHMLKEATDILAKVNKKATLLGIQWVSTAVSACVFSVSLLMFQWFICGTNNSGQTCTAVAQLHHS